MVFPGRVIGINLRSVYAQTRYKVGTPPPVVESTKSMIEFELDSNTRLTVEIDGEYEIGKKFEMEITAI